MKKLNSFFACLLLALSTQAQTYDLRVDTQYPERELKALTMLQGANPSMRVYVRQGGALFTNIATHTATFYGGPSATNAAFVTVANASVTPASGYFTINFDVTDTNTNTTDGAWWYTVLLRDASGRIYYSGGGEWNIVASTAAGAPGALDLSTPLGNVDMGSNKISNVGEMQFSGGTGTQGTLSWNAVDETLDLVCDGAVLQMGQEFHKNVVNGTALVITNGQALVGIAIDAPTDNVEVRPMIADGTDSEQRFYGIATEDIAVGAVGKSSTAGKVRGLDTSAFNVGDNLYISATTAGALTATAPSLPNKAIFVGLVLVADATDGVIDIKGCVVDQNASAASTSGVFYADGSVAQSGDWNAGQNSYTNVGDITGDGSVFTIGNKGNNINIDVDVDKTTFQEPSISLLRDSNGGFIAFFGTNTGYVAIDFKNRAFDLGYSSGAGMHVKNVFSATAATNAPNLGQVQREISAAFSAGYTGVETNGFGTAITNYIYYSGGLVTNKAINL